MLTFEHPPLPDRRVDVMEDGLRVATIGPDGWIGLDLRNAVGFGADDWRRILDVADDFSTPHRKAKRREFEATKAVRHG